MKRSFLTILLETLALGCLFFMLLLFLYLAPALDQSVMDFIGR